MPKRTYQINHKNIMDYLVQTDIESQIRSSQTTGVMKSLSPSSYFTPRELDGFEIIVVGKSIFLFSKALLEIQVPDIITIFYY